MLTNRDVTNLFTKLERDKLLLYVCIVQYGTFLRSFLSAHETWDQHFTCCARISVQCNMIEIQTRDKRRCETALHVL